MKLFNPYIQSQAAWKELYDLMVVIDSHHWVNSGERLQLDVARDLAVALTLKAMKDGKRLVIDTVNKTVEEV